MFPAGKWPDWVKSDVWAPDIQFIGGRYHIYYSARMANKKHGIGVAMAEHPFGPYKDVGQPILEGDIIDCHWFRDPR